MTIGDIAHLISRYLHRISIYLLSVVYYGILFIRLIFFELIKAFEISKVAFYFIIQKNIKPYDFNVIIDKTCVALRKLK